MILPAALLALAAVAADAVPAHTTGLDPGAAHPTAGAPPAGLIQGVIRSSAGDRPVAYANIEVVGGGVSDWSTGTGEYALRGLPEGRWRLRVVHANHESLFLDVFLPAGRGLSLDLTLQARPGPAVDALGDFRPFRVEYTLPALLNTAEVTTLIQEQYPPELAAVEAGGETVLMLWLDERGQVVRTTVSRTSGHPALDSVAERVARQMRFRPARNRDQAVRVIVQIPVFFTVPPPLERMGEPVTDRP